VRNTYTSTIIGKEKRLATLAVDLLTVILLRTTEGSFPPASVSEKWPRDLSTSVALNGDKAKPIAQPFLDFEAMDVSGLVSRRVAVPTQVSLQITIDDKPKNIVVEDSAAKTEVNPPETVKDKSMLTWNARVRVKK
jgi:hypothetical protein